MHTVQLGNAALNLTDHAFRERPEVHVQRHQHHNVTQRAWIGLSDLDEGLPERLANLRQGTDDLVYTVDAAKPLADVAIRQIATPAGPVEHDGEPRQPSGICRRAEHVLEHGPIIRKDVTKRTPGVEIAAERAMAAGLLELHEVRALVETALRGAPARQLCARQCIKQSN